MATSLPTPRVRCIVGHVSLTREELLEQQKQHQRVKEPDAPLTPQQEQMLKLQTGVGNAALARAMLNRELPDLVPRLQPPQPMDRRDQACASSRTWR